MKNLILLLLMITMPCYLSAKRPDVKKFEMEFGLNHTFAAPKMGAKDMDYKFGFYMEGRWNFNRLPIDAGFQLNYSTLQREGSVWEVDCRSLSLMALGDYSFRRGHKINPYVGMGIGATFNKEMDRDLNDWGTRVDKDEKFYFMMVPRVGVKFLNRINVSFDYIISKKDFARAHLRIGYYF